ncbi:hypothetical protein [Sutcliffiella rhizosphaerae]|uniref:hypothetical protein n=1 Tax=Sutcliffiella rhizosphaerae TaxID=2880967 RepID=UPI001E34F137|nr:hypothetical protein [Sutcliffiella rhizosphaerae]
MGVVSASSFVLLIVTSSLVTAGRAGVQANKSAKPSRLRASKEVATTSLLALSHWASLDL